MIAVERQRQITEMVNERGSVRVAEISQLFDVTPETARRDLDVLEREGKLLRSHGGAIRMRPGAMTDVPYIEREGMNASEKMQVAAKAAGLVSAGDRIALDASSTAWYLARALPDVPVTVLTNSIRVIQELANRERIEVISSGGILRSTSMSLVGPQAEETLSKYHVNKAFVSCKGVHASYGVSESNELQALVKRKMADIADETILLCDHTKLGVRDFTQAFTLDEIDAIVTDSDALEETVAELSAAVTVLRG